MLYFPSRKLEEDKVASKAAKKKIKKDVAAMELTKQKLKESFKQQKSSKEVKVNLTCA